MPTLQDAITQVQTYMVALPNVRAAPSTPPKSMDVFPFIVTYPERGTWLPGTPAGAKTGLHNIAVELHVTREDLSRDYTNAIPFCESIPNALIKNLYDSQWNHTISTFAQITYTFGNLEWAGQATLGWRFIVEGVKMQSAVT